MKPHSIIALTMSALRGTINLEDIERRMVFDRETGEEDQTARCAVCAEGRVRELNAERVRDDRELCVAVAEYVSSPEDSLIYCEGCGCCINPASEYLREQYEQDAIQDALDGHTYFDELCAIAETVEKIPRDNILRAVWTAQILPILLHPHHGHPCPTYIPEGASPWAT